MKWTGLNELREKYLQFFESKGHLRLPSFSLIPNNDKSLLLINSGMAPMKKYFTGEITPPRKRVTTCQKCIRTPDIERVGKTARHGTYFEMLGNFSFGDYFKHEVCPWAWEFCTEVLELPKDRIYISIYENDDEAFDVWTKEVGVPADHIVRLGKEDNFWEHGSGPCGPCSELYFDRGEQYGCGSPTCGVGCDCDRFMEFWNLVFTQFDSDGNGNYAPLDHPNIDTGMGLERLACVMQGVGNLFEVDTVQNILKRVCALAGVTYGEDAVKDTSIRVITDHIRSTTVLIGDGVLPSNEGRGYVLRRLLRRAARHGRLLGIRGIFLHELCETVIADNEGEYPVLREKSDYIRTVIRNEEEAFEKTIDSGLALLEQMIEKVDGVLSGEDAFRLYDTYGFPLDLTRDILEEKGLQVDEAGFTACMQQQRERARAARKNAGADAWKAAGNMPEDLPAGTFVGYEKLQTEAKLLAAVCNGESVDTIAEGESGALVLDVTPFYAESGGQVGDVGVITADGAVFEVTDTVKTAQGVFLHTGVMKQGSLQVGGAVTASVAADTRKATMRNHSAAHLLQAALRRVLGTHTEQAGQLVDSNRMRFDFTHFSAMTSEQLAEVEAIVNGWILNDMPIVTEQMPIEQAKAKGAMALFGEKYGDVVRVVSMGDASAELCGGTHAASTAQLGLFHILSESSVAAGVRRIEAVTGGNLLAYLHAQKELLHKAAAAAKIGNTEELPERVSALAAEAKEAAKALADIKAKSAADKVGNLLDNARQLGSIKLLTACIDGADGTAVRSMCDSLRDKAQGAVVAVLAGKQPDAVSFACFCSADAVKAGAHAGNIVRAVAAVCGGKGGGRPDSAMAGAKDVAAVDKALADAEGIVAAMIQE